MADYFGLLLKKSVMMTRRKATTDKDLRPKTNSPTPQASDMINERINNMNDTADSSGES